ncbi:hypothetical protein [Thioclava atlantica]|uniref:Uncharacterized protein n=1 Tax=Thioclava atlantica TaxID=1317124 RepID=A0A085U164_9RHOB|nr:hypothetical protein [Thioclava atlantica]KFE36711.1 hypothetical protein DW2_01095 [Thioclava atlantica]
MKPEFALILSHDGIALARRAKEGWALMGDASLEAEEPQAAIVALHDKARQVASRGFASKLVLPDTQILYTAIYAPGPSPAQRRKQIEVALEGMTPYAVPDLVYDFTGGGQTVQVAVIARETLAEAERFAEEYGFCPVSFVAAPDPADYPSEPHFGLTSVVARYLPEGARVDPDTAPVRLLSADTAVVEEVAEVAPAESAPSPDALPASAAEAREDATVETRSPDGTEATDETPLTEEAKTDSQSSGDEPAPEGEPQDIETGDETPEPAATQNDETPRAAEPATEETATTASEADEEESEPASEPAAETAAAVSFATRRAVSGLTPADEAPPRLAGMARFSPAREAGEQANLEQADITAPSLKLPGLTERERSTSKAKDDPAANKRVAVTAKDMPGQAPSVPTLKTEALRPASTKTSGGTTPPRTETDLTVFGAQKSLSSSRKPRHLGLLAAGGAALLLALVALWSQLLTNPAPPEASVQTTAAAPAASEAQAPASEQVAEAAEPSSEPAAAGTDTAAEEPAPTAPEEPQATATAEPPPAQMPAPMPALPEIALAPPASTTPPQTETAAPPTAAESDAAPAPDASADTAPATTAPAEDTVAQAAPEPSLPPFTAAPLPPPETPPPPPTPEGVEMPGGFTLFAGKPARLPRGRPESVTQASAAAAQAATAAQGPDPKAQPHPELRDTRPRPRPDTISGQSGAATPAETPASVAQGDIPHPPARPQTIQDAVRAAVAAQDAAAEENRAPFVGATPLAVARSPEPPEKPRNFSRSVETALAAAIAAEPAPSANVAAAAPAKPEDIDEPEPVAPAPKLPTSASVAKQATEKNAINLRKLNLIGLYGSSANRRALVRLPTGRFIKVGVGDRLDGGTVTAIGSSQLTYRKNRRDYTLKLLGEG